MEQQSMRAQLTRVLLIAALALFAVPALTYGFVRYAQAQQDREHLQHLERQVRSSRLPSAEQATVIATFSQHPLSGICHDGHPDVAELRTAACDNWGQVWQFDMARKVSLVTLLLDALILLSVAGLGALAFINRSAQFWSLVVGWRVLMLGSAFEVVVQGVMCLWLSFWVTAFFFERYYIKLVAIAALFALVGIAAMVMAIFRRPRLDNRVVGEPVSEHEAPLLWRRVRQIATVMKTAPPDHR